MVFFFGKIVGKLKELGKTLMAVPCATSNGGISSITPEDLALYQRQCREVIREKIENSSYTSVEELDGMITALSAYLLTFSASGVSASDSELAASLRNRWIAPLASFRKGLSAMYNPSDFVRVEEGIEAEIKEQLGTLKVLTLIEKTSYVYKRLKKELEPDLPLLDPEITRLADYDEEIQRLRRAFHYWTNPHEILVKWNVKELATVRELTNLPLHMQVLLVCYQDRVRILKERYGVNWSQISAIPFASLAVILQKGDRLFEGPTCTGAARGASKALSDAKEAQKQKKSVVGILLSQGNSLVRICEMAAASKEKTLETLEKFLTSDVMVHMLEDIIAKNRSRAFISTKKEAEALSCELLQPVSNENKFLLWGGEQLDSEALKNFFSHSASYKLLFEKGVTNAAILEIAQASQAFSGRWVTGVGFLLTKCGLSLELIKKLSQASDLFINYPQNVQALLNVGINVEMLVSFAGETVMIEGGFKKIAFVILFGTRIAFYCRLGLNLEDIFALDKEDLIYLRGRFSELTLLLTEGRIPLDELRKLSKEQRLRLAEYSETVVQLRKQGESLSAILEKSQKDLLKEQLIFLGWTKNSSLFESKGLTREKLRGLPKSHLVAFLNLYTEIVGKLESGGTSDDILKDLAGFAKEDVVKRRTQLRFAKNK